MACRLGGNVSALAGKSWQAGFTKNRIWIWLASRRLHQGKFVWSKLRQDEAVSLQMPQLQALVVGLPWQYAGLDYTIKHL